MGNKISHHNQAVARELAGSRQALGRLMSMARSRQGASKEQARSWLGYGLEQTFYSHAWNKIFPRWEHNIPTLGTKHSQAGNKKGLRLVISLLMMMVLGVNMAWGQTDYSGIYYIASDGNAAELNKNGNNLVDEPYTYSPSTPESNYYLVPASNPELANENDAYFDGTNREKPFLTTYKIGQDAEPNWSEAVWVVRQVSDGDGTFYYIMHAETSKYVIYEPFFTGDKSRRKCMHLDDTSPSDAGKFVIEEYETGVYDIVPKSMRNKGTGEHKFWNIADRNRNSRHGVDGSNYYGGLVGLYSYNGSTKKLDVNSRWKFEKAVPKVSSSADEKVKLTFPVTAANTKIRYTTDGSDPTETSTQYSLPLSLPANAEDNMVIKVIATVSDGVTPTPNTVSSLVVTLLYKPDITLKEGENDVDENTYIYDGSAKKPTIREVSITKDSKVTAPTTAYSVTDDSYSNNTNAGDNTASVTLTDVSGDDWYIWNASRTFTISPKVVAITASDATKTYDGSALTETGFTASALETGDTHTFTVAMTAGSTITNVGTELNVIATVDGVAVTTAIETAVGNYKVTTADGTLKISERPVTFSGITAADKVYDRTTTVTLDYSEVAFGGLIEGDALTISVTGAFADANAGTKTVNITNPVLGGGSVANYQLATEGQQTTTTATISKKPVTVSGGVTVQNKVYDGTTTATFDCSSATIDGKIAGDDLTVSATGTFANPNVGEGITVTFTSFVLGGESADNYVLESSGQQASTTANITPATLTVTADAKEKVYGETDPALTYTPTGLAEGDNLATILNNGALTRVAGENVGSYAIGQGTLDLVSNSGNYTLSYVGANLTITEKNLNEGTELAEGITIEITKSGDAYVPVVQNNGTDINVNDYIISTTGSPSSKYYEVTIEGANNYSGSVTVKYANYKSGKKDTTDETEDWSGTFVSDSGDGDIAIPSGMSAYIVTGVNGNAVEVEELDYIPEDVPVLLLSDNFAYCFVVKAKEGEGTADTSGNLLEKATGTPEQRTMAVGTVYLVYNGEFVLNMPGELPAGTVYLPKSAIASSRPVYARLFINWGETTGIENTHISTPSPENSGPWYTLDGRRLTNKPVKKGLYLRKGEKIVIR